MKTTPIQCRIDGFVRMLNCRYTLTSIRQIFIYDQLRWVATIYKGADTKYRIVSCGAKPFSITELEIIGKQIDSLENQLLN